MRSCDMNRGSGLSEYGTFYFTGWGLTRCYKERYNILPKNSIFRAYVGADEPREYDWIQWYIPQQVSLRPRWSPSYPRSSNTRKRGCTQRRWSILVLSSTRTNAIEHRHQMGSDVSTPPTPPGSQVHEGNSKNILRHMGAYRRKE